MQQHVQVEFCTELKHWNNIKISLDGETVERFNRVTSVSQMV